MQQLNVLSINVSPSVEVKDDSVLAVSTSAKDDFSQHIDLHLAKNKGKSPDGSNVADKDVEAKLAPKSSDENDISLDDEVSKNSDLQNPNVKTESAKHVQNVAGSGNNHENILENTPSSEAISESEKLMSFLIKADKTLVNQSEILAIEELAIEESGLSEMSTEQKAKYEAQLLLNSSELVADLSGVAKALNPNQAETADDLAKAAQTVKSLVTPLKDASDDQLLDAKKEIKEDIGNKINTLLSNSDEIVDDSALLVKDKTKLAQHSNAVSSSLNVIAQENDNKASALAAKTTVIEPIMGNDLLGEPDANNDKIVATNVVNSKTSPSTEANVQHKENALTKSSSDNTVISKQTVVSGEIPVEAEDVIDPQLSTLTQKQSKTGKPDADIANPIFQQKQVKNSALADAVKVTAENNVKQNSTTDSDIQLQAKSVEQFIAQNKEFNTGETKELGNKATSKTSADIALNHNFIGGTSKSIQAAQEMIDQHVAEVFNPSGSAEVAQSQKTNAQLHQETIAIFRKDFSDAVKDKVMLMISQKLQQFDIKLDPPELGNMQVRVNLQGEQASVNFVVQNQQAKEALEQNMHKLRDLLQEQGVNVGDANVEQQSQQSDNEENTNDSAQNALANTADASDVIEHNLSARMINSSATGIDYYA